MLRLCRLLCTSSTGRTVGRAVGASLRRRRADTAEVHGKASEEIFLPWCTRPTYDIHTNEWKYLDRMLAGVIGMTDQEVSERSLRLVGRDLLCEVEDPVMVLRRQRLQPQKRIRQAQSKVLLPGESESAIGSPRGHRQSRKDANPTSETQERAASEDRLREGEESEEKSSKWSCAAASMSSPSASANERVRGKSHAASEAGRILNAKEDRRSSETTARDAAGKGLPTILTLTGKISSSGVRIRTSRTKGMNEEPPRNDAKSPLHLATLLRGDGKKIPEVVNQLRLRTTESTISNGNVKCISNITRNETATQLDFEANKCQTKKQPPHSGIGTRKRMPSRKVKDKSEISVHLV